LGDNKYRKLIISAKKLNQLNMGCHGELVEPWWAASARTIRQATHDITIKQCKFPLSAQRREGDQRSVVG